MRTGGREISVKIYTINYEPFSWNQLKGSYKLTKVHTQMNKVQNKGHYLELDLKNEIVITGWIL